MLLMLIVQSQSYRHQDFARAAELYRALGAQRGAVGNEDMDLRINTGATYAQLEWADRGAADAPQKPQREDMDAFETAYNAACQSIARDELGQAEVLLKRAKELCDASDMAQEEKEAEIMPITIQQIYVLIRQGRLQDAQQLAATVDSKECVCRHAQLSLCTHQLTKPSSVYTPSTIRRHTLSPRQTQPPHPSKPPTPT
jgi:signal recognition particle subunit SRP72